MFSKKCNILFRWMGKLDFVIFAMSHFCVNYLVATVKFNICQAMKFLWTQNWTPAKQDFWMWWWWWIVFVVWLADEMCLAFFSAGSIVRDPHHRERYTGDTLQAGFEPAQNLISGLVQWSCAEVVTTTPQGHVLTAKLISAKFSTHKI